MPRPLAWLLRLVMFPLETMGRITLWLSAANLEVLREFPSDRAKYVGMGSAVLFTSSMAGLSAAFAMHMTLHAPMAVCVILGILWGLAIMGFDRWLVAAGGRGSGLFILLPRFLVAIVIGLVVSTPITLQIFDQEIQTEITRIHRTDAEAFAKKQKEGIDKTVKDLEDKVTRLSGQTSPTAFNPGEDPSVQSAKTAYDNAETAYEQALTAYNCEVYGNTAGDCSSVPGLSGRPGANGPVARGLKDDLEAKKAAKDQAWKDLQTTTKAAEDAWNKNSASTATAATNDLGQAQQDLADARTQQKNELDDFTAKNNSNTGLLIRMQALDQLGKDSPTMRTAHYFLIAFFTLIECLPILVKLFMALGKKNDYELALESYNEARLAISRSRSRQYRMAQTIVAGDLLTEAQAAREDRDNAIEAIAKKTVAHQSALATRALELWHKEESEEVERDWRRYLENGPRPAPTIVQSQRLPQTQRPRPPQVGRRVVDALTGTDDPQPGQSTGPGLADPTGDEPRRAPAGPTIPHQPHPTAEPTVYGVGHPEDVPGGGQASHQPAYASPQGSEADRYTGQPAATPAHGGGFAGNGAHAYPPHSAPLDTRFAKGPQDRHGDGGPRWTRPDLPTAGVPEGDAQPGAGRVDPNPAWRQPTVDHDAETEHLPGEADPAAPRTDGPGRRPYDDLPAPAHRDPVAPSADWQPDEPTLINEPGGEADRTPPEPPADRDPRRPADRDGDDWSDD